MQAIGQVLALDGKRKKYPILIDTYPSVSRISCIANKNGDYISMDQDSTSINVGIGLDVSSFEEGVIDGIDSNSLCLNASTMKDFMGQCAITATLVYDLFGGTIHKIRVDGGGTHYFNKINNHYIDLTSNQFEFYDIPIKYEPNEEVPREFCKKNVDTLERFNLLVDLLNKKH